ncbi:hypothetical protein Leryth_009382 [Lithospermum erythrorhizon]|nr:hypothetical protein Leryth_009382 [Lithospermum erythrorhizon]
MVEQQGGSHLEGVPFYGPRGVCTGSGLSSRMSRTKRSNLDSFLGSSREMLLSARSESLEDSHLTKYPPRASQAMPFGYLNSQSKSRDTSAGPSVVSQAAADEGSRTGIKGSGIWSSINATAGADKRSFSRVIAGGTQKPVAHISEFEFVDAPSGHGLDSANRQMTIFYGGQAHVFDNVHPKKADAIMSLASSNGGSWSTTFAPKLGSRVSSGEHHMPITDNATKLIS